MASLVRRDTSREEILSPGKTNPLVGIFEPLYIKLSPKIVFNNGITENIPLTIVADPQGRSADLSGGFWVQGHHMEL